MTCQTKQTLEQEKLNLNAKTDHLRSMLEVGVYRVDPE
jgi:hypothetical protein